MNPIGLYRLNELVKQALKKHMPGAVWVIAEIADIKENRSGHCYLELIEKRDDDDAIIASSRAVIWSFLYRSLKPAFEAATGRPLQRGLKVLIEVEVTFHELYGYSLNIKNVDLNFTIGSLEQARREIIDRLTREEVIDMNRSLPFPELPKTIAVISSSSAAGYEDFMKQLRANPRGYAFHACLFHATMQGEKSAESVIDALDRVSAANVPFDVVVIVRGGGSRADLSCFNSYDLALNVACFPLPVLAGIGHDRDESIVDRVAHRSLKTPTAVADFLLAAFQEADRRLEEGRARFAGATSQRLQLERQRQEARAVSVDRLARLALERQAALLARASVEIGHRSALVLRHHAALLLRVGNIMGSRLAAHLQSRRARLEVCRRECRVQVERVFAARKHLLELAETKSAFADPRRVLEQGYAIARVNGKLLRGLDGLKQGDVLETELLDGRLESEIKQIKKH
jgi:exodeoxyribonuclease VII large subunit